MAGLRNIKDPRSKLQRFFDGIYGAPNYTIILSLEQAEEALMNLQATTERNWEVEDLTKKVQQALSHPVSTGSQTIVILRGLDTSQGLLLKRATDFPKSAISTESTIL